MALYLQVIKLDIMQILAVVSPVIIGPDIIESRGNQDKPMQREQTEEWKGWMQIM